MQIIVWLLEWKCRLQKNVCCIKHIIKSIARKREARFWKHNIADLLRTICNPGFDLSRVIHRIQSEIIIWKPWLVYRMIRYGWPSVSGFRIQTWEPPPLLWQPPPSPRGMLQGMEMVMIQFNCITYLPTFMGGVRSSDTWAHGERDFHHLSSLPVIIFEESHHFVNSGVKSK